MAAPILFITPPFTQLNTPYPATAYLTGYLRQQGYVAHQADLGLEVTLRLFSKQGLEQIFHHLDQIDQTISENAFRIYSLKDHYLRTITPVIQFLQNKKPTLAHLIVERGFLPEASRFQSLQDLAWAFGHMGIQDKARHLATLYLEDLGDLVREVIDPHFGFTRYAERIARAASSFDPILEALDEPPTLLVHWLEACLEEKISQFAPEVIGLSVPFPGNVLGAFQIAAYVKKHHPKIKIVLGGGYANTELRRLADPRVFHYLDFVTLDDGEAPIQQLMAYLDGQATTKDLKRTFHLSQDRVVYQVNSKVQDIPLAETGTPTYADLPLDQYLSVMELVNPMHRLWSDGRWNKLTLAHGCYWGKCSFCDVSLDYISRYEPVQAEILVNRMEEMIQETGEYGFHFVDEAAPPALLRDVALEIIRRNLTVVWWTNIRFEKNFTYDLARLLKRSGCIALSGGLEVASDRLLARMKKGVTVAQVARVAHDFTRAGIMVHAYLMYGFPTQTEQETIDSWEVVRQMFLEGVLQSGFWHQFAMTAHSPVGLEPAAYEVETIGPVFDGFAENDLFHEDPNGANHDQFGHGLHRSLFNFMQGVGLEEPVSFWFDFPVPTPSHPPQLISEFLSEEPTKIKLTDRCFWIGGNLSDTNEDGEWVEIIFSHPVQEESCWVPVDILEWLELHLPFANYPRLSELQDHFPGDLLGFLNSETGSRLREIGWLIL